jgi:Predicted glycosyltransferases
MNYFFYVNDVKFHTDDKKILIIRGWFKDNNPNECKVKVYFDKDEFSFDEHKYTGIEIRKRYIGIDSSVDTEYYLWVNIPKDVEKYKKLYVYSETETEKQVSLEYSITQLTEMRNSFPYCIDDISFSQERNVCQIKGWAISKEPIEFEIIGSTGKKMNTAVTWLERQDVAAIIKEATISPKCGFQMEIPNCMGTKLLLIMRAEGNEIQIPLKVNRNPNRKNINYFLLIGKGLRYLKEKGIRQTIKKTLVKLKGGTFEEVDYGKWRLCHLPSNEELQKQRETQFEYKPKFSIVVPLYKTPENYLHEFVKSIKEQTYDNWELILSDGSGENSPITSLLKQYENQEKRIKVVYNQTQLRISENTNEALKLVTGDFIVFADHDDLLAVSALFECVKILNEKPQIEIIYTDEDKVTMDSRTYFQPHFKSDFNIDLLRSMNYISHLFVVKKKIVDKIGVLNPAFDGAQDYDFILRCIEASENIYHIPKVLYHWRAHMDSTAENPESKMYAFEAGKRAIEAHYKRVEIKAEVFQGEYLGLYRTKYIIDKGPLISIIIPNKDHTDDLDKCISSIEKLSPYKNYEYIIVENNSTKESTFAYYKELERTNEKVKVVYYKDDFNYSLINNFGVQYAKGDYILLLNNDTEIINEDCLTELLGYCMREDVGIVGARLYYEDDIIQHAGTVIGFGGIAGHTFIGLDRSQNGYFSRIICAQNYSAVTAACLMVKKSIYEAVGGLSPEFKVAFNDVDFCLKVREYGKLVVYNPYAELYHYESKSRGLEDTPEKVKRFNNEIALFGAKWEQILRDGDPYYNSNLTLDRADFALK